MINIKSKIIAKQFRKPMGILGNYFSKYMVKGNTVLYELLEDIPDKDDCRILEIGFGPGTGLNTLLERNENIKIDGVDFSKTMYKKAKKRNSKYISNGRLSLEINDVKVHQIENHKYDRVIAINVIYFWEDLNSVFKNIYSALKENGVFIFFMMKSEDLIKIEFTQTEVFNKYEIDNVINELKSVGFKNVNKKSNIRNEREGFFIYAEK